MSELSEHTVFILGASAVGKYTALFAREVGFAVTIADDDPQKLDDPMLEGCTCLEVDFEHIEGLAIGERDMVCVITRGHSFDRQAFAFALKTPAAYVGMMGSAKKNAKCFAYALENGCTQEQIDASYAPIGLDIGAVNEREIGLAVAAELVKVHNSLYPREKDHESLHRD